MQPAAPAAVQTPPISDQNVLVNLQQSSESDQEPWVKIQEPSKVEPWVDLHGLDVKTGTETVGIERASAHVDPKSEPQAPMVVTTEHSLGPKVIPPALNNNNEVLAANSEKVRQLRTS